MVPGPGVWYPRYVFGSETDAMMLHLKITDASTLGEQVTLVQAKDIVLSLCGN